MKDLLKYELYPYQRTGAEFALSRPRSIIADDMGLGKTRQSLAVVDIENLRTLIVCPASLKDNWKEEIKIFCPGLDYYIESYSSLHKLKHFDFEAIIGDESHYLKDPKARRTQTFISIVEKCNPKKLIMLSGTPIKNRVPELFVPLALAMQPNKLGYNYWDFCRHFSNEEVKYRNGYEYKTYSGIKNEIELVELLRPYMIRRSADKVLDLPEIVEINVSTDENPPPDYKQVVEKFIMDNNKTPEFMMAKRLVSEAKIDFTVNYVSVVLNNTDQVIVFSDHINTINKINKILSKEIKSGCITGETDVATRDKIIKDFKDKKIKVLCSTIGVGSTGHNLQNCSHVVFNDFPFVPSDLMQAKKRIHRIGQKNKCFYHYVISNDIDRTVLKILQSKTKVIDRVMDGVERTN